MERLIAIDLSRAYLLARHNFEARLVLNDTWLSNERRIRATCLYVEIGRDFNDFFLDLRNWPLRLSATTLTRYGTMHTRGTWEELYG